MFHTILLTTDFSQASRVAFGAAGELARKFHSRLLLVHVAGNPPIFTPWQVASESEAQLRKRRGALQAKLREFAGSEPAFRGLDPVLQVVSGSAPQVIAEVQERERVDLIAIATHGYSGLGEFPLGSFTSRVLEQAACPVLVFQAFPGNGKVVRSFDPRTILVPHDLSSSSFRCLEHARSWAQAYDSRIRVLSVLEPLPVAAGGPPAGYGASRLADDLERAKARDRLNVLVREKLPAVRAEALVRSGSPLAEVLDEVHEFRPDLIILPGWGLWAAESRAAGSLVENIIHKARCPVLMVDCRA